MVYRSIDVSVRGAQREPGERAAARRARPAGAGQSPDQGGHPRGECDPAGGEAGDDTSGG